MAAQAAASIIMDGMPTGSFFAAVRIDPAMKMPLVEVGFDDKKGVVPAAAAEAFAQALFICATQARMELATLQTLYDLEFPPEMVGPIMNAIRGRTAEMLSAAMKPMHVLDRDTLEQVQADIAANNAKGGERDG